VISIKKAISYRGLCGAEKSSGTTVQRTTSSKQRNKHLQTTLIDWAKERKLWMLPLISFETAGKTQTQSSVQDHSRV
jgi:transposase